MDLLDRYFIDHRLAALHVMAAVRSVDFRTWGILSGISWISSCSFGVAAAFNNDSSLNLRFAILISGFGILASLFGILSVTGIWRLFRVRHTFFSALARRLDYQIKFNNLLGVRIDPLESGPLVTLKIDTLRSNFPGAISSFSFAKTDKELRDFSLINSLAYYENVFGQSPKKKYIRNREISRRNFYSQMLLRRDLSEEYWGISALLPMTDLSWEAYSSSTESDNELDTSLISSGSENGVDHFDNLLIFSIGAVSGRKGVKTNRRSKMQPGLMVLIGIFEHIARMVELKSSSSVQKLGNDPAMNVYVAANDSIVIRVFQSLGFVEIGKSTGDDIPILRAKMVVMP